MAIDSKARRKAAMGIPFIPTPPVPDGEISAEDRAALAGVYGAPLGQGGFADYAENKVLDHITGKTSFSKPTTHIGFCTANPGEGATGANCSEVANANGYSRIATTGADWNAASGGMLDNANAITSPEATGSWGTVTYWILVDSGVYGTGNVLIYDKLDVAKAIEEGDLIAFAAGELSLALN